MRKILSSWISLVVIVGLGIVVYFRFYHGHLNAEVDPLSITQEVEFDFKPQQPSVDPKVRSQFKEVSTVYVVRPVSDGLNPEMPSDTTGLLFQELVRQAIQIAAHDELGLRTPDVLLGDGLPSPVGDEVAIVTYTAQEISPTHFGVELHLQTGDTFHFAGRIVDEFRPDGQINYVMLTEKLEYASRHQFVKMLQNAGLGNAESGGRSKQKLSPQTDKRLKEMNCFAQLGALQQIHASFRKHGDSPELLGGLVRGYANLGQLIHFHWNASNKVCKARSLLYAQRLYQNDPKSAAAKAHRAYALALTGLQKHALDDLQKVHTSSPDSNTSPKWASHIESFCRFETDPLLAAAQSNSAFAELAAWLAYQSTGASTLRLYAEYAHNIPKEPKLVEAAELLLALRPECFDVYDTMSQEEQYNIELEMLETGPRVLSQKGLEVVRRLPSARRHSLGGNVEECWQTLSEISPKDDGYQRPSLAFAGKMLHEIHFIQTYRILNYRFRNQRFHRYLQPNGRIAEVKPFANHPYRSVMESFHYDNGREFQEFERLRQEFVEQIPIDEFEWNGFIGKRSLWPRHDAKSQKLFQLAWSHSDAISSDLKVRFLQVRELSTRSEFIRKLIDVSPYDTAPAFSLIRADWNASQQFLPEWNSRLGENISYVTRLAGVYEEHGDPKAETWYAKAVEINPTYTTYTTLANYYKSVGKFEKFHETLAQFLDSTENDRDHSLVHQWIARHHIEQEEWDDALEHALIAVKSERVDAMKTVQDVYEGRRDFISAESWVRRISQSFYRHRHRWYLFCARTGHGDMEAARKLWDEHFAATEDGRTARQLRARAEGFIYEGKFTEASDEFKKAYEQTGLPSFALHAALASQEAGEANQRDQWMAIAYKAYRNEFGENAQSENYYQLLEWMHQVLSEGKANDTSFVLDKVEAYKGSEGNGIFYHKNSAHLQFYYFAGKCLLLVGQHEDGLNVLRHSLTKIHWDQYMHTMAKYMIHKYESADENDSK